MSIVKNLLLIIFIIEMIHIVKSFSIIKSTNKLINISSSIQSINSLTKLQLSSVTSSYKSSEQLNIAVSGSTSLSFDGDVLAIPFYKPTIPKDNTDKKLLADEIKKLIPSGLSSEIKTLLSDIIDEGSFKADSQSKVVVRTYSKSIPNKYIALVGLGLNPKKEEGDYEVSTAVKIGKSLSTIAKDTNSKSIGVIVPTIANSGLTQLFLGLHDQSYNDNRFKKTPEGGHEPFPLQSVSILGVNEKIAKDIPLTYKLTEKISSGVDFAKDLVGAPPNSADPYVIASLAKDIAKDFKLDIEILGKKECLELQMGGYLGVQQGSKYDPQFIHLTYKPDNPGPDTVKVALVGKGLTFDSGGYNLKVGAGSMIELMKFDMGGCAAVLGCAKAIAQLRPRNVEVHFITAVCENMISAEAMKPGDILTSSNGKTIEVLNTDAEGRLTLADALVFADRLGVDKIIDLATLTGACIVALGEKLAGLYSPDASFRNEIEEAAKRTDEGIWPLPLESSYKEFIKSNIADLRNIGAKGGGSITAALFLQEFVDKATWAHIDMAGPVWDTATNKPTGYGVKLLVDLLLNIKK